MTAFLLNLVVIAGVYAIVALSLNLLVGYTGVFSIAHAALFGVGAYSTALLSTKFGWGFLATLVVAVVLGGVVSALISAPALRVSGDYFAVASFGMQIVMSDIFVNWTSVTRGPAGVPGVPSFSVLGVSSQGVLSRIAIVWVMVGLAALVARRMIRSPFGRVLRAIREDETGARALGKKVAFAKTWVAVISGGMAGAAGSLFALHQRYVDPQSFDIHQSILILAMVIVGGAASIWGPLAGAALITSVPELLRLLELPSNVAGPAQQVMYGLALLLAAVFLPQGLLGEREVLEDPGDKSGSKGDAVGPSQKGVLDARPS